MEDTEKNKRGNRRKSRQYAFDRTYRDMHIYTRTHKITTDRDLDEKTKTRDKKNLSKHEKEVIVSISN